ncbi:NmrA/HSCARG family protein [Catenulispora yoronensis]|uniref:NmrA/HSCARG family protein n=1 Tax=Catenulispora yoronensis TaxID=450799 RepID=A0ABN2UYC4_9ACTN
MTRATTTRPGTVVVIGATGNQGGATARHLLADGWSVRALVRDRQAPAASALAAAGAELVLGDLNDRRSVEAALQGAYGVFSVQAANPDELAQGLNVAYAAQAVGVQHFVYASVGGAESQNSYYVEHGWEPIEKWQIEERIRELGLPATVLRPAGFMEDFVSPDRFFQNGALTVPWRDDIVIQLIAIDDIGALAARVFAAPDTYLHQAIDITGDQLTAPQIAAALGTAADRAVPSTRLPLEVLWEHAPEAAKVFEYVEAGYYDSDVAATRAMFPGLQDFGTWLDRTGRERLSAQLSGL